MLRWHKLVMLRQTAGADHKQCLGRISRVNLTATIATKPLNPLITAIGNFQIFFDRSRDGDLFSAHHCHRAKRRAAKFLAICTMTGHDLIGRYSAVDRDFAAIAGTVNFHLIAHRTYPPRFFN